MTEAFYRGRFAPSPTGPLHYGSLIAAVASYLQARSQRGEWWIRIEDIDPPREQPGASDAILKSLEAFGFEWDDQQVIYQSNRIERYHAALEQLKGLDLLYPCTCSRKEIASISPSDIYPGTCRHGLAQTHEACAWRLRSEGHVQFEDAIQGAVECNMAAEIGDFVLLRADGLVAYQLAVGLDDAEQNMTEVVRGADLFDSTHRQMYLQKVLGLPAPRYAHHPVVVNSTGNKLSKQNHAPPLDSKHAVGLLWQALRFLGQSPPVDLKNERLETIWQWAITHWTLGKIPKLRAIQAVETGNPADN